MIIIISVSSNGSIKGKSISVHTCVQIINIKPAIDNPLQLNNDEIAKMNIMVIVFLMLKRV